MSNDFKREDRYFVIKRSDLDKLSPLDRDVVKSNLEHIAAILFGWNVPDREYLVIESDWPEYEPAWAAIKARVTGESIATPKPAGYISDIGLARLRAGRHASITRARTNRMTNALYLDPELAIPKCPNCDGGTLQAEVYRYKCTQCEFECGEAEDE
ncbi:hypothetical protein [Pseudomonas sp. CMR5c]|uniref:hypothetical protein n=1 Tax=Pseudomonas sp. CMR5c TaxID=658630 RepID=UPI00069F29C6|nr:hypothetical protein [Pseudomonas sp. CMR5c]AZC19584.1 hypothetical protein C4K40_4203 [Pseudomonas sp. CMR5c]